MRSKKIADLKNDSNDGQDEQLSQEEKAQLEFEALIADLRREAKEAESASDRIEEEASDSTKQMWAEREERAAEFEERAAADERKREVKKLEEEKQKALQLKVKSKNK